MFLWLLKLYVPPPLEVKFNDCPVHTELLLAAVAIGAALIVMLAVAEVAIHPPDAAIEFVTV